jgi:hypothetical protein
MPISALLKCHQVIAENVVETLFDSHLDMDVFLPALAAAMQERVSAMRAEADEYETDDLTWADNQERDAKLLLSGLDDAISDLAVVGVPFDAVDMCRVKSAESTLRNLKRRFDSCR